MKQNLVAAGSGVLGVVVGLTGARLIFPATDSGSNERTVTVERIEHVLAAPLHVESSEAGLMTRPPSERPAGGDDTHLATAEDREPAELIAEAEALAVAQVAELDEILARRPSEADRASSLRAAFANTEGARAEGVRLGAVACSDQICRIELHHASHGSAADLALQLSLLGAFSGPGFTAESGDDATGFVTLVYVGVDGFDIHPPDMADGP